MLILVIGTHKQNSITDKWQKFFYWEENDKKPIYVFQNSVS